jgi:MscS family membrane protein
MKWRLESVFKAYVCLLVGLLLWSVWASAAETNAPSTTGGTNTVPVLVNARPVAADTNIYLTFGLNRVEPLRQPIFGIPAWQYIASAIYILIAFLVARLLDWMVGTQLRRWAERTTTRLDDILISLVRGPIKVVAFVILLHVGLRVFHWPDWFTKFFSKGLHIVVALSLTYVALKFIDVLMSHWQQRSTASAEDKVLDKQLFPIIRNSLKVFVVVVAVLLTSQNLGLNITGLIASLSIGGLAIGLAAQDTLGNLFGAVAVFADKPFRVGDQVRIENVEGAVEAIGMRSTRVRTADGHLVAIPNKTVGNAVITNIAKRPTIRTVMNLGLTYDTTIPELQRALALLEEIFRAEPMTKDVIITFNRFTDSALNIEVVHFWDSTDFRAYLKGLQQLNIKVKEAFDREGIEFAFPTRTLHIKESSTALRDAPRV